MAAAIKPNIEERLMEERDLDIIMEIEEAMREIAESFDLHFEQVKAIYLSSLSPAEAAYAIGEVQ